MARQYKNDTSIGNVFGTPLKGRRVKNDYIIDSSNSIYPYASRIPIEEEVTLGILKNGYILDNMMYILRSYCSLTNIFLTIIVFQRNGSTDEHYYD